MPLPSSGRPDRLSIGYCLSSHLACHREELERRGIDANEGGIILHGFEGRSPALVCAVMKPQASMTRAVRTALGWLPPIY